MGWFWHSIANCPPVRLLFFLPSFLFPLFPLPSLAQEPAKPLSMDALLSMSLDELMQVEVAVTSRRATKLRYVAENISIITAKEIRAMNANSVNEILRTVTGVQVYSRGGDFGSRGAVNIHSSSYEHVLLLLDGVRLNDVDAGYPETGGIPVQIIDRIEIVKGPASSAWGSALGGVINIVTKQAGTCRRPTGTLYGSYGEGASREFRADAAGRLGSLGYYLYGGAMDSDGLVHDRSFDNTSFYSKFSSELADDVTLTFTGGYWYPDAHDFDWPAYDWNHFVDNENYLVTGKLDAGLAPQLRLNLELYVRGQDWHNHDETMSAGALIGDENWEHRFWGGNASLTWDKANHTMLFGAEAGRGENDRTWLNPATPPFSWQTEKRNDWALYFNDTIKWEKLALIPGLRYDHLSIVDASTDDIVSPSLGATYAVTEDTLIRGTAARGFIKQGIGLVVGEPGYAGDPDLQPEDIWSLQAGVESTRFKNTHLKADVFYHQQDKTWYWDDALGVFTNGGESERTGFEFNVDTSPLANVTAGLGLTYIWVAPYQEPGDDTYGLNLKLGYQSEWFGSLMFFGRYYWWNEHEIIASGRNGNMLCELHYNRDLITFADTGTVLNLFLSVRNIFNSSNYVYEVFVNPERWVQGGLRIRF